LTPLNRDGERAVYSRSCWRPARSLVRRQRIAAAIALGAWSTALTLSERGTENLLGSSIDPPRGGAARHLAGPRWPWAPPCGLGDAFGAALVQGSHVLLQASAPVILIIAELADLGLFLRLFGITAGGEAVDRAQAAVGRLARLGLRGLERRQAPCCKRRRQSAIFFRKLTNGIRGRVFQASSPTGNLHLGNYLGAIVNFVKLQETHNCIYCVSTLHARTQPVDSVGRPGRTRAQHPRSDCGVYCERHRSEKAESCSTRARCTSTPNCMAVQLRGAGRLAQSHDAVQDKARQGPQAASGRDCTNIRCCGS